MWIWGQNTRVGHTKCFSRMKWRAIDPIGKESSSESSYYIILFFLADPSQHHLATSFFNQLDLDDANIVLGHP